MKIFGNVFHWKHLTVRSLRSKISDQQKQVFKKNGTGVLFRNMFLFVRRLKTARFLRNETKMFVAQRSLDNFFS